ncbi:hypothetical protein [Longimicrobium sp.]|uniref:hypothetical protein n=1 Tax=Longimicrobium sp. TaxID=2029185 RepID=UPI002E2EBBEE|nr:hypothetical protein [Longimicrobium sp.]HEX6039160.1 hypothetical protein [Longimicrobium sp.]
MRILIPALVLAACGGGADGAVVEGTFGPGLAADGVWVVESERGERADSSGFRLADLTPGPVSLRLIRGGDTAAVLNVSGLPDGARLRLEGLRVDGDTRYAFPRSIELDGADVVTVNGMRLAPAGRIPREVDVEGAVLAWSSDIGALLVRPADARMPDLRVVVGMATEVVGTDGGGADAVNLRPGDSIRVEGRADEGYVVATRITMPVRIGGAAADADSGADGDALSAASRVRIASPPPLHGDGTDGGGGGSSSTAAAPAPAVPIARAPQGRGNDDRGRGRGRGEERGKGRGHDKKNRG